MPPSKAWKSSTNTSRSYQPARLLAMLVPVFVLLVVFVLDPLTTLILLFTGPVLVLLLALIGSRAKEITERRFLELELDERLLPRHSARAGHAQDVRAQPRTD